MQERMVETWERDGAGVTRACLRALALAVALAPLAPAVGPRPPAQEPAPQETPQEDPPQDPVPQGGEPATGQDPEQQDPEEGSEGTPEGASQDPVEADPADPVGAQSGGEQGDGEASKDEPEPEGATGQAGPAGEPAPEAGDVPEESGEATGPAAEPPPVARPSLPVIAPAYRDGTEVARLLGELARAGAPHARLFDIVTSADQSALNAIEFGRPGDVPLAERPTVLLLGGLDGVSLAGGESVLAITRKLLEDPDALPEGVSFVAVPWAAPRSLARALAGELRDGRGDGALDEDGDGRVDEDGPDDVDGDGMLLSMLIEDARGEWATCLDGRFLVPAGPGDAPRFRLAPEGRDDDGDGRFNEDPVGGVVLDRNFPLGRDGAWSDPLTGRVPLSEPEVRALADLVLARRTAVVLLFQGNHGGVAMPGGSNGPGGVPLPLTADRHLFERATEAFSARTGRVLEGTRTLREARGREVHGAALDWFYAGAGAFALEVAPWGPRVDSGVGAAVQDARFTTGSTTARALDARPEPSERDRLWSLWLDNTRGGIGFVDWHPVELGGGEQAFVGGWEPRTIDNPPLESLPRALDGLAEFTLGLAQGVPRLEVRVVSAEREGEVVRLRARVKNLGALPTGLAGAEGPGGAGALRLELGVPAGARLIAGEPVVTLGRLGGGELSRDVDWILLAPEGALVELRSSSELALPVSVEVRP